MVHYFQEIEGSVDDYTDDELSEINQQKAGGGASSDTEADFLDKVGLTLLIYGRVERTVRH